MTIAAYSQGKFGRNYLAFVLLPTLSMAPFPLGSVGNHIIKIGALIGGLIVLLHFVFLSRKKTVIYAAQKIILFYVLLSFFSFLFITIPSGAINTFFDLMRPIYFLAVSVSIVILLAQSGNNCADVLSILKIFTRVCFLYSIIFLLFFPDRAWHELGASSSARFGGLYHPNEFGLMMACGLSMTLWKLREKKIILELFWLGIFLTAVLISGSHTAVFCSILVVFLYFFWPLTGPKIVLLILITLNLAMAFFFYLDSIILNLTTLYGRAADFSSLSGLTGRLGIWRIAWGAFLNAPFLGHGFLAHGWSSSGIAALAPGLALKYYDAPNAHNVILNLLMQYGIVGTAVFTVIYFFIARNCLKLSLFVGRNIDHSVLFILVILSAYSLVAAGIAEIGTLPFGLFATVGQFASAFGQRPHVRMVEVAKPNGHRVHSKG